MSNRKSFFAGIALSFVIGSLMLMLSGAVTPKSNNLYKDLGFNSSSPSALQIACSTDGSVVYVSDASRVMRSRDYGTDWQIVMTRFKDECSEK